MNSLHELANSYGMSYVTVMSVMCVKALNTRYHFPRWRRGKYAAVLSLTHASHLDLPQRAKEIAPDDQVRGSIQTSTTLLVKSRNDLKQELLKKENYRTSDRRGLLLLYSKDQIASSYKYVGCFVCAKVDIDQRQTNGLDLGN